MTKTVSKRRTAKGKSRSVYVARHRQRQKRAGLRRMEVAVKPKDTNLLQSIVLTLHEDGPRAERLRQYVQSEAAPKAKTGTELYTLLRRLAPLADEIDLTRRNNISRPVVQFD